MSRLNQILAAMALTLTCTLSAEARQGEVPASFPPTLKEATDWSAVKPGKIAPRASQPDTIQRRTDRQQLNPQPIEKRSQPDPLPKTKSVLQSADKVSAKGQIDSPSNTSIPNFAKPLSPFPREQTTTPAKLTGFARSITPFPRTPTLPQRKPEATGESTSTGNNSQFGTIMSFPAAENKAVELNLSDRDATPLSGQVIRTSVIGPEMLFMNEPETFEIEVTNYSDQTATNIVVQMGVSDNLTITDFDRRAWMDETNRTVSWQLPELQSGYKEVIRFRGVSTKPGRHKQSISVGMDSTFQGRTNFVANVIPQADTDSADLIVIEK